MAGFINCCALFKYLIIVKPNFLNTDIPARESNINQKARTNKNSLADTDAAKNG